ncbi:exodeoxyribonuclease VII small subunit [Larsenimonas salina]|uniref:exodeoxyribonuclease VII small subunit n=1 Tax=Larsenimonas salina TaxID=1295565 RepID=UPI002074AA13|nr:exodeoxyribonuclease VII small subunit [Larsenimonas salina]MCM5704486.1 exodeoxyribonuclease VII small subunit [Larsenimonas salina]
MAEQDVSPEPDQASPEFAETLSELETLVNRLESGELSLESSLEAFEEGVRLTRAARERLSQAELKVQTLTQQGDSAPGDSATKERTQADPSADESRQGGR